MLICLTRRKENEKIIILTMIMTLSCLFAQTRDEINLTIYLANAEVDGQILIEVTFPDGTSDIDPFPYYAGDTVVQPYNSTWPLGFFADPAGTYIHIYAIPENGAQPSDYEYQPLNLPGTTVYDFYMLFENPYLLTSFDMINCASVYTYNKCSFRISGQVKATYSGPGSGVPQDYGLRYNVNSVDNNLIRDFYVQPIETWDEWYDFTVEFNSDYSIGSNLFLYAGYNHFIEFGIYPEDRTVYVQNIQIEFEYVPDFGNEALYIESYNTSGTEWHPRISWDQLVNFPTAWLNYFEIEIWRQKDPIALPIEDWELISVEDMNTTSYIDYELYSAGGSGLFGITGTARYKIKLAQTTNNPNYDVCLNIPNNDEWNNSFDFSDKASIYYGSNSGISVRGRGGNLEYQVGSIYASSSTISFSIIDDNICNTEINLYNIKGQLIRKFTADDLTYGRYSINWNGTNKNGKKVSSGMYLLKIQRGDLNIVKKALLVK